MDQIQGKQVINGTYGEAWLDSTYVSSVIGLEALVEIEYEDVNRPRKLGTAKKMLGYDGTGTLKFNKVNSLGMKEVSDALKAGRQPTFTIMSKLEDPDALGAERVVLEGVTFNQLNLINWEAKTIIEEEMPFNFEDWDTLDRIE